MKYLFLQVFCSWICEQLRNTSELYGTWEIKIFIYVPYGTEFSSSIITQLLIRSHLLSYFSLLSRDRKWKLWKKSKKTETLSRTIDLYQKNQVLKLWMRQLLKSYGLFIKRSRLLSEYLNVNRRKAFTSLRIVIFIDVNGLYLKQRVCFLSLIF
jgi:hypothetical protein